jgi:hypothetical protein
MQTLSFIHKLFGLKIVENNGSKNFKFILFEKLLDLKKFFSRISKSDDRNF